MKFRVGMGMGMGMAEKSGYGYTHFWVWPKYPGMGMDMGMAHKFLGALKIARFSCSTMNSTIIRVVSLKFVCFDAYYRFGQNSAAKFMFHCWRTKNLYGKHLPNNTV